jgi:hypothetical protein
VTAPVRSFARSFARSQRRRCNVVADARCAELFFFDYLAPAEELREGSGAWGQTERDPSYYAIAA